MKRAGIGLLCWLAACGAARAEVTVKLTEPRAGAPVFGEMEVAAEVHGEGEEVLWVEFTLDGRRLGRLAQPPWRMTVEIARAGKAGTIRIAFRDERELNRLFELLVKRRGR